MRTLSQIIFISLIVMLCSYAQCMELNKTCSNGLSLSAEVNPKVVDFRFWENLSMFESLPHINANLRVLNTSNVTTSFSNRNLLLSVNGLKPIRAYVNSIASQLVDSGDVFIKPNEVLQIKVYWPVRLKIGTTADKLELLYDANSH